MSCYISSNDNRVYAALETSLGTLAAVTSQHRVPTVKLSARQRQEPVVRRDKTGSRTFPGLPNRVRRQSDFKLTSPMTSWADMTTGPSHGPLFQAALGGQPRRFSGVTVATVTNGVHITTTAAHGLQPGQAVTHAGELRFVSAVESATGFFLNGPFTQSLTAGAGLGITMTYSPGTDVGSATLYDYWDPSTAVQRLITGAVVDELRIRVNGDFHEFEFSGPSKDIVDSASYANGQLAGVTEFPQEPAAAGFDYTVVPGHLGQVWLGSTPTQFLTLTSAQFSLKNHASLRAQEFGSDTARCAVSGQRSVGFEFSLLADDEDATKSLYQAARERSPISVMLVLGEQVGQLVGVYLPAVVPEVPEFDDGETRLTWKFRESRAQGSANDEVYVAFG